MLFNSNNSNQNQNQVFYPIDTQSGYISTNNTTNTNQGIFGPNVKYFVGGMIAAYAITKFLETERGHDILVDLTSGILEIKDNVEEQVENIRENAEDIHNEAQEKKQIEIFGPEDVDEQEDEEDIKKDIKKRKKDKK